MPEMEVERSCNTRHLCCRMIHSMGTLHNRWNMIMEQGLLRGTWYIKNVKGAHLCACVIHRVAQCQQHGSLIAGRRVCPEQDSLHISCVIHMPCAKQDVQCQDCRCWAVQMSNGASLYASTGELQTGKRHMQGYAVMCRASTARDVSRSSECTHHLAIPSVLGCGWKRCNDSSSSQCSK